jgi:NTE family protein
MRLTPSQISPWRFASVLSAGLLALAGVAHAESPANGQPTAAERPRIGLALGGGGARGGAHIGVLKVLDELRVPVDCIAGTSMGALVGATFASGASADSIEVAVRDINWAATIGGEGLRTLAPMQRKQAGRTYSNTLQFRLREGAVRGDGGLLSSQQVEEALRMLIGAAREIDDFDNLPIPFRAVATDLAAARLVVLDKGDLSQAMRASMAVPGVFAPVVIDGQVLVDGGLMRNLPVDVARNLCADVVIAVTLQAPPPGAQDLQSMFTLAGRSVDAIITGNEQLQLETLTERDVSILVPVGDITSAQFERVVETIRLGENAARANSAALLRYAVPEEEYLAWRAGMPARDIAPVHIREIRFTPLQHASADYLESRLRTHSGDVVSFAELEQDMSRIFASGDFARVDYRLEPMPGEGHTLVIDAVERAGGADYLRFDLGLAGSSGGDVLFALRADHRREWINALGGQWRNALQLGQLTELETAFYQPLDVPQRYYVEPRARLSRNLEDIFDDGDRIARYDLFQGEAGIDLGANFGNYGRLSTGLRFSVSEFDLDIGSTPGFGLGSTRDTVVRLGGIYDTRDANVLPTSGALGQFEITSASRGLGGEESYDQVEAVVGRAARWGSNVVLLAAGAGWTLRGDLPRYRDFTIGGIRSFPALSRGELRGENYWAGSATWALKLGDLQALFGPGLFAGFGLHAVRVTDRIDDASDETVLGVSFSLGARTLAGPLMLSLGAADNGRVQLHMALGRPILEGALLDRMH